MTEYTFLVAVTIEHTNMRDAKRKVGSVMQARFGTPGDKDPGLPMWWNWPDKQDNPHVGQLVRMKCETTGNDEHDSERTFPVGAYGRIACIEMRPEPRGRAITVEIEGEIINVFNKTDGNPWPMFFEPV